MNLLKRMMAFAMTALIGFSNLLFANETDRDVSRLVDSETSVSRPSDCWD